MKPEDIKDIETARLWLMESSAQTVACRSRHEDIDKRTECTMRKLTLRVSALEKKIWIASGAYVFAGWALTLLLPYVMAHVTGQ